MPSEFYKSTGWQQSSGPEVVVQVHESDVWPIAGNSGSGAKDGLFDANGLYDGVHPVVAIGGRTTADGRPENLTGVVESATPGSTTALGLVRINIADGAIKRDYVANILTYTTENGGAPATFETTPIPGQPIYVDDSADLGEGVTLSMSPLNEDGLANPLAGWLWYCQDEYANYGVGGENATSTFDGTLANELVEQVYCVLLTNDSGQACCDVAQV